MVDELSKVFTRDKQQLRAVNNTTFTVHKGDVLALLGPRGAGKSTALDVMLGLCPSSGGTVSERLCPSSGGAVSEGLCPSFGGTVSEGMCSFIWLNGE